MKEGVSHAPGGTIKAKKAPSSSTRWRLVSQVTISVAILAALAWVVDWAKFARIAVSAELDFLLLAAALVALGNLAIAWRWQLLLVPVGVRVSVLQAWRSYLKGHFVAHFVPSAITADVIKGVDMHRFQVRAGRSRGVELASSIFVERAFGVTAVAIAVLVGLAISPLTGRADLRQDLMLASGTLVMCCMLALFFDRFLSLVPEDRLPRLRRVNLLITRARASLAAYRRQPFRLIGVLFLSLLIQGGRIATVFMIALSIGEGREFFAYLIAVPVIFLANMVPVVGNRIGAEQGLFVLLLGLLAGVRPEAALAIALVTFVLSIIVALPGAYWVMADHSSALEPE